MTGNAFSLRGVVALLIAGAFFIAACGSPDPTPAPLPTPTPVPLIEEEAEDEEAVEEEVAEPEETPAPVEEDMDEEADAEPTAEATEEPMEEPTEEPTEEPMEEPDAEATPQPEEEADTDEEAAMDDGDDFLASITLPDGTTCLHAGRGATLAFDDMRLNYTCDEDGILLGDMDSRLDLFTVTYGVMVEGDDGHELESSEEIEMRVAEVTLADGSVCLNAGQGATLAFDEGRANFTCDETDEGEHVLLGDMSVEMDVVTVTRGVVAAGDDGFELAESETVYIVAIVGVEADE